MKLKIKELRVKKNLTQDELCELSGIKKRSLLDYESGKTDVPFSKLHNIATALNVSVYDLIDDGENINIVEEPKPTYGKEPKTDIDLLVKNNSLLKEQNQLQEEIIVMLREKVEYFEEKYNNCENQKKLLADSKKMD